ncbi:hypothetical protein SAMN05216298_1655 [Glycomyces sambucus]|uniref:DUF2269 domain-containing protein n=1 Tax=Glycomyces sambucus TaxID=380244 RepID=A0A1G9F9H9_9ACTN|nr:DUF2269 domain-containing protein [Glycomyces sambucus]SDK85011.1 hypothetical protein SAMN05216298_1655 [Glycomyces sambucus]
MRKLRRPAYRFFIVAHVASSVAWLGLSLSLLVLAVRAVTASDAGDQFAAGTAMDALASTLSLPIGAVAIATGLVLMFGTRWGPSHKWVLTKLVLTCAAYAATVFALLPGLDELAALVDPDRVRTVDAGVLYGPVVSSLIYLGSTVLSYVKPWGRLGARRAPAPARVPARSAR